MTTKFVQNVVLPLLLFPFSVNVLTIILENSVIGVVICYPVLCCSLTVVSSSSSGISLFCLKIELTSEIRNTMYAAKLQWILRSMISDDTLICSVWHIQITVLPGSLSPLRGNWSSFSSNTKFSLQALFLGCLKYIKEAYLYFLILREEMNYWSHNTDFWIFGISDIIFLSVFFLHIWLSKKKPHFFMLSLVLFSGFT